MVVRTHKVKQWFGPLSRLKKGSGTNGTNLACLSEPRGLAEGLRRILTTFTSPTAIARGSKPVLFGSGTSTAKHPEGRSGYWYQTPFLEMAQPLFVAVFQGVNSRSAGKRIRIPGRSPILN